MASRKIADGSPGVASTSGVPAALGGARKLRAVATAVTASALPPPRNHGRVTFLRKAYQQARATIVAPPADVKELAPEHQEYHDSEDEESENQEEENSNINAPDGEPLPSSRTSSKKQTSSRTSSKNKTVSDKWQTAQSMVTGAGKALTYHNDMVQKIRLAAQGAFERHRLQKEMMEALSASLQADLESAAPGIGDCIEDILYDITDAKVKDRAAVSQKVLSLIMSPEETAALQSLRDCLISQLEDDLSVGDDLERVYQKLAARVTSMRERFQVLQVLQDVPASEQRSLSKKFTFSSLPEEVQTGEARTDDPSQPPGPRRVSGPRPDSGPKPQEGKPTWGPRPATGERLPETQPTLQPSAQLVLVSGAPTPCPAPIELGRQPTLQQVVLLPADEDESMVGITSGQVVLSPADEDESMVGITSGQYVVDNRERLASNDQIEGQTLMRHTSSPAEEVFSSGDSTHVGQQSQRGTLAEAEPSRQQVFTSGYAANVGQLSHRGTLAEVDRPQEAPPMELNRPGFGELDLPPLEFGALDLGNFRQDNLFEMIVVGRSPRSKPTKRKQLNLRFPLLPMFSRTPREDQLSSPKFDPCRSVAKAAGEVFPSLRSHAATTQSFLPVLPKTLDAGQPTTQSWRSRLGSAPSFSIGNGDRAQTWNERSFV